MNDDLAYSSRTGEQYLAGPDLWTQVPDFEYEAPPAGWVLRGQTWSLGLLGVWAALATGAAVVSARRVVVD